MGLFDGAFGGGNGILPDWLFNPQAMASMPNAMDGGSPAGSFADMWSGVPLGINNGLLDPQGGNNSASYGMPQPGQPMANFADRWSGVSGMPRMQSVENSPLSVPEMLGGGRMAFGPERPSMNPINVSDSGQRSVPQAQQPMPSAQQPLGQPAQDPGIGGRLQAAGAGFFNAGSPMQAIGNLLGGLVTGERQDSAGMQQQAMKAAVQYVAQAQDIEPGMKQALIQNPAMAVQYLQSRFKGHGSSSDIAEYEYSKKQGDKRTFEQWMKEKRTAGAPKAGLQPVFDSEGNVFQLTSDGELIKPKGSENFKLNKGVEMKDTGTHWQPVDRVTGREVGKPIPKNIEEREAAEKRGAARGEAQVSLPNVLAKAEYSTKIIDDMLKHPGRETATGLSGALDPRNYFPGTSAKDFQIRQKQLQGRTFLEAFEGLKGGGAISEKEGEKAEQAIARLDLAQSDEEYVAALRELKDILSLGMQRARQRAQQPGGTQQSAGAQLDPKAALKQKYGLQ